jgi:hypothetical protein
VTRPRPAGGSIAFVGALALGVAVRAVDFLNCRSLGLDEARLAVNIAARSWAGLLQPLDLDQSAPPLFLWGERLVFLLSGCSDCALRLLPVLAGTGAALLTLALGRRFLGEGEARLATLLAVFSPLLITYSNAVKQYSVEALAAVALTLYLERETRREARPRVGGTLLAGALAPWLALTSVFVLWTAWAALLWRARRLALWSALVWGASGALAYITVYRAAGRSPYLQRFWEQAFVTPARADFLARAWKSLEDQVWGFVAGDPLVDRTPYLSWLHVGTVIVALICVIGCVRVVRTRGGLAGWWLAGPLLLTMLASVLGIFPVSPRLSLYLLPGLTVLFAAGIGAVAERGRPAAQRRLALATGVLTVPLMALALLRTLALEPSRHFQRLVDELRAHRRPDEPVYVFARTLPAWIYYSTDWSRPDTARLRFLVAAGHSTGPAFENAPSRGAVSAKEAQGVAPTAATPGELLGLPSGMEWREVQEHARAGPDSGWVEVERRRIEQAASPGVWVLATAWYAPEAELFAALERDAARRTYARIRGGSALVRYEFAPADTVGSVLQSQSPATFGRRSTATTAGR